MKNKELINQLSCLTNQNKTTTIITLLNSGYNFNKLVGEQDNQVDEKLSEMLLNSLVTNVPTTKEEPQQPIVQETKQEVVKVNLQLIEPVLPQNDEQEDKRYTQLNDLFNQKKVAPNKRKDRVQLVEQVLDLLIPTPNSSSRKGRVLKDKHKRSKVSQLIANSVSKEQLSTDLLVYIDDCVMRASKR